MESEDPYTFEYMQLNVIPKSTKKNKKGRLSKTSIQNARCTVKSLCTSSRSETVQLSLDTIVKCHMAYTRVKYPFLLPSQIKGHTLKELGLPNCMGDIPSCSSGNKKSLWKVAWTKRLSVNSLAIFNFSQLLRNFLATALEHQHQSYASRSKISSFNTALQDTSEASLDISQVSNCGKQSSTIWTEKQLTRSTQRFELPPPDLISDDSHSNRNASFSPCLTDDISVASASSQLSTEQISSSHLLQQRLNITQCETITVDKEIIFDKFDSTSKHLLFNSPKGMMGDYVRTLQKSSASSENEEHITISADESGIHDEKYSDVSSDSIPITPWRVKSPAIQKLMQTVVDLTTVCTDPFDGLKLVGGFNTNRCKLFDKLSLNETISISEHSVEYLSETDDDLSSDDQRCESPTGHRLDINEEQHTETEKHTDLETESLHQPETLAADDDSSSEISPIASLVHSPDKPEAPNGDASAALTNTSTSPISSIEVDSECHSDLGYDPSPSTTSSVIHALEKQILNKAVSSVMHVLEERKLKEADTKNQLEHSKLNHSSSHSKENIKVPNLRGTPVTLKKANDEILSTDMQDSLGSHSSPGIQIQPRSPTTINHHKSHLNHKLPSDFTITEECENTAAEKQDDPVITDAPQVLMSTEEKISTCDEMQRNVSKLTPGNTTIDSLFTTNTTENNEIYSDWKSNASLKSTDDEDIIQMQILSFSEIQKSAVQHEKNKKKTYKISIGVHNKKAKKQKTSEGISTEKIYQNLESITQNRKDPTYKKSLDEGLSVTKTAGENKNKSISALDIKVSEGTPKINKSLQLSAGNEQCEIEEVTYNVVTAKVGSPSLGNRKKNKTKVSEAVYIAESFPKQRTPLAELSVVTPETSHHQQQALFKTPTTPHRTRFKSRVSGDEKSKQSLFTTTVPKEPLISTPSPIQTRSKTSSNLSDYEDDGNSGISDAHSMDQESITSGIEESLVSDVTNQKSISETSEKSYLNKIANTKFAKIVSTPNLKRKFKDTIERKYELRNTPKKMMNTNSTNIGNKKDPIKKQVGFQGDDVSVLSEETDVDSLAKIQVRRVSTTSRTSLTQQQTSMLQSPMIDLSTLPRLDPNLKVTRYLSGMTRGSSQESYLSSLDSSENKTPQLNQSLPAASECSTRSFLTNMFELLHDPSGIQKKRNKNYKTN